MRLSIVFVFAISLLAFGAASKTLDIYVIDVEGGNATLFITPAGESVLIDTGNGGPAAARDSGRILAALKEAGVRELDHLITTHWHGDHFGGMADVVKQVPVKEFIDHGGNVEPGQAAADNFLKGTYPTLYAKAKHRVIKAGDKIPLAGVDWRIVAAGGEHIVSPLPGAGKPNPYCSAFKPQDRDVTENAQSVGSHVSFGKFRALHLGDLTWNKEFDLMCPQNRLGTVDLWIVSHHGQAISNSEVLAHAIRPRAAIVNNGIRKGGQPEAMRIIHSTPGLEDLWQMHFSELSGQEYTVAGMFIANSLDDSPTAMPIAPFRPPAAGTAAPPAPAHNGTAYWLKVSAQADGTFTITNTRNNFSKTYTPGN